MLTERGGKICTLIAFCVPLPLLHGIQASMAKKEISSPLPPCLSAPASYPCHSL